MAEPPKDKKLDISSLPRGAISIKGLPVSRNTRLPSIRSPRDLTLGGPPKRTFMPNIPVRRERKPLPEDNAPKKESIKSEKKPSQQNDKGRGRGRLKQIIQSQGSIFADVAATKRERTREAYSKSEFSSSSRGISIKKEKQDPDAAGSSKELDLLFRDDFIDDGDDDVILEKPTVFPPPAIVKKEEKEEMAETSTFNPDIAKKMDFDVNLVAKFIKKEKGTEVDEKKAMDKKTEVNETDFIPSNEVINLLRGETSSNLMLLQFPDFINVNQKMDDSEPSSHKKTNDVESKPSNDQDLLGTLRSLPEGHIGKLQITKSGKVKLIIGTVEFNFDPLESKKAKHEVASISTNSNAGDLTVLGQLKHKLVFAPNEDCFLT